jgi:hypothetical protein
MTPRPDWLRIRALLWERSGGRCEVSGLPLDPDTFDVHHRINKGMGGTTRWWRDDPANLLALDPYVHNGGPGSVHADRPWSEQRGYLLPKLMMHPPHVMPAWLHSARWVFLTSAGTYVDRPEELPR